MGPLYILRQEGHILRHPERHTERDGFDEVGGDRTAQLVGPLYILRQEGHMLRHPERHTERGV